MCKQSLAENEAKSYNPVHAWSGPESASRSWQRRGDGGYAEGMKIHVYGLPTKGTLHTYVVSDRRSDTYIYIDTDRTHAYPNRLEAMKRRRNTGINTHNEVETCKTATVHISIAIPDGKREQTYLSI